MLADVGSMLYPFTAFLFIRIAMRCLAAWSRQPRWSLLIAGILAAAFTIHAGWCLYAWTAVLPHWWITWLVTLAFVWVFGKNFREIWEFRELRSAANTRFDSTKHANSKPGQDVATAES